MRITVSVSVCVCVCMLVVVHVEHNFACAQYKQLCDQVFSLARSCVFDLYCLCWLFIVVHINHTLTYIIVQNKNR